MYCLRTWSGRGIDGDGTLASVTFEAKAGGLTSLHLSDTILGNSTAQRISHTTRNGQVQIGKHDIAVVSAVPWKTICGQNCNMNIDVTIENQGDYSESFNVTLYADSVPFETKTVTLAGDITEVIVFRWNTTGFAYGNYTVTVHVWPVDGESDISDNDLTDGIVRVGIPGDINKDGHVTLTDLVLLANAYSSRPGDPKWNGDADINGSGAVDLPDLVFLAKYYGKAE
jgi:hypothetical protein